MTIRWEILKEGMMNEISFFDASVGVGANGAYPLLDYISKCGPITGEDRRRVVDHAREYDEKTRGTHDIVIRSVTAAF